MDKIGFLRQTPLFSSCSDQTVKSIAEVAKTRQFAEGDVIIREDSQSTVGFYILLEGAVKVTRDDKKLAEFGPGEYFGEIALLLDGSARTATVTAMGDVKVLAVTRWDFKALLKTNPDVGIDVMAVLAQRLANTDRALRG
jgi:CRP-like cAMP-binding protein